MMLGQNEDEEQLKIVQKKYGFDQPIFTQYLYYLNDLISTFFAFQQSKIITPNFLLISTSSCKAYWNTKQSTCFEIPIFANIIYTTRYECFTNPEGYVAQYLCFGQLVYFYCLDSWEYFWVYSRPCIKTIGIDKLILVVSTLGMSLPSFFSAIIFAWLFGFLWHEFTGLEMTGNLYELDDFGERVHLQLKNLILPALVLGIRPLAVVSQLMRNSLLEVFNQEYIKTARAKGLERKAGVI